MYAVIKAGGKQQRVKPGDVIEVELMHGQHGDGITFSPLLVVDDEGKAHVGKELGKATVKAKLVGEQKGDKIKVFKYRQKTGYKKTQGHRQMYTLVEIEDVSLGRRAPAKKAEEEPTPKPEVEAESATAEPEAPQPEAPSEPADTPASESVEESEGVGQPADESAAKEEAEA